jgi:hypothetical protein
MTVLLDATFPRTLDGLAARFATAPRGTRIEAWLFEDEAPRRAAEAALLRAGVEAKLRSAYKPLLHFFLEETRLAGLTRVAIATPAGDARRWRLEAYPLAGLLPGRLAFADGDADRHYIVSLNGGLGTPVFAPNKPITDHLGEAALAPCGWLRVTAPDGTLLEDGPLATEHEQLYAAAMQAVAAHPWPAAPPFFRTLAIDADLPGIERVLPYHDEVLSTREALHEDFYFSILELLKHRAGLAPGDRTLQPGQIVPDIRDGAGDARIRVTLADAPGAYILTGPASLDDADRPLTPAQIETELAAIGGTPFSFPSVQGRPIHGRLLAGAAAPIVLSAGQHANETSGPIGLLRAARVLREAGSLALIPCKNPDGYALHHRLRVANPRHMHHAARYTALGDDLESRTAPPLLEREALLHAIAATGARLHLNLHGYPAHEWTRPFSGYLPRGFELWTIPKGFFLIMRHRPGLAAEAEELTIALAARLAEDPALAAFNAEQLATWRSHAGAVPFPVHAGIPCLIGEHPTQPVDFTIITEYPDETIYGDAFRLAHTTQMRAVLAAVELFRG